MESSGAKVLVVFYSTYGHVYQMAKAVVEGVKSVPNVKVDLKRVQETLSTEILTKLGAVEAQKAFETVPIVQANDLVDYDAIIFGTPTRFGIMSAQMKTFIDSLGQLWATNKLVGKLAGVFTSTATQHGGQETTIVSSMIPLFHLGFIIAGLPYSFEGQKEDKVITGCSPYGASTIAGPMGARMPSENELAGAKFQGKHIAELAVKLAKK